MIEALKEFSRRHPDGIFVMGTVGDCAASDRAALGGLLRSRAACQVTNVQTAVVSLRFDPLVRCALS
jgi:hypothetical protein